MMPRWIITLTWLVIIAFSIVLNLRLLLSGFLTQAILVFILIILIFSAKTKERSK